MSSQLCHGSVKEGGKNRPCKRSDNQLLANGFCAQHQKQAVQALEIEFKKLENELNNLEQVKGFDYTKVPITPLRSQMILAMKNLKMIDSPCDVHSPCGQIFVDVLTALDRVVRVFQNHPVVNKIKEIGQSIDYLRKGTLYEDAAIMDEQLQRTMTKNHPVHKEVDHLKTQLTHATSKAQEREMEYQTTIRKLTAELEKHTAYRQAKEMETKQAEQQLDRCKASQSKTAGLQTTTINKLIQEKEQIKSLYDELKSREYKTHTDLNVLKQVKDENLAKIKELEEHYKKKIDKVREEYAAHMRDGKATTEREEELMSQIEILKEAVQEAADEMKEHKEAADALRTATEAPSRMLLDNYRQSLAEQQRLSAEVRRLMSNRDDLMQEVAQLQTTHFDDRDRVLKHKDEEIERLAGEIDVRRREIDTCAEERLKLRKTISSTARGNDILLKQLKTDKDRLHREVTYLRQERSAMMRQAKKQQENIDTFVLKKEEERKIRFQVLEEGLREEFKRKARMLRDSLLQQETSIKDREEELRLAQAKQIEVTKDYEHKEAKLLRLEKTFNDKMIKYSEENSKLQRAKELAHNELTRIRGMEKEREQEITMLRNQNRLYRRKYDADIDALRRRLEEMVKIREGVTSKLRECSASRSGLVQKISDLTRDNAQLEQQKRQLENHVTKLKAQYNAFTTKMQMDADRLHNSLQLCGSKLKEATQAHEDVKRMKNLIRGARAELEDKIRTAKGSSQAVKRLLQDKQMDKQELARLRTALKNCSSTGQTLKAQLIDTNRNLHEMDRMQTVLGQQVGNLQNQYRRQLDEFEAEHESEKLRQQSREKSLESKVKDLQTQRDAMKDRQKRADKQKHILQNALLDSEIDKAQQMDLMLEAQRLENHTEATKLVTGEDRLFQA